MEQRRIDIDWDREKSKGWELRVVWKGGVIRIEDGTEAE